MDQISVVKDLVEKLSDESANNNHLITACVLVVLFNIVLAGINLWLQFRLKDKEKHINSHNLREGSRIKKQEKLYSYLDELRYFSNSSPLECQEYLQKIFSVNNFITKNGLYLSKAIVKKTSSICDYFLIVISDYSKKDVKREEELFKEYIDEFNS